MRLSIPVIFQKLDSLSTDNDRALWLRKNDSSTLRMVLLHSFDRRFVYNLPEGTPPHKPDDVPEGYNYGNLFSVTRILGYLFLAPSAPGGRIMNLKKWEIEKKYIEMLETLHPTEIPIAIAMKDKTLTTLYPVVTLDLVNLAFPGLVREPIQQEIPKSTPDVPPQVDEPVSVPTSSVKEKKPRKPRTLKTEKVVKEKKSRTRKVIDLVTGTLSANTK